MRAALGITDDPVARARTERHRAAARAQLDEAVWAAAWADGQAMSLDEAIAYALTTPEPPTGRCDPWTDAPA